MTEDCEYNSYLERIAQGLSPTEEELTEEEKNAVYYGTAGSGLLILFGLVFWTGFWLFVLFIPILFA